MNAVPLGFTSVIPDVLISDIPVFSRSDGFKTPNHVPRVAIQILQNVCSAQSIPNYGRSHAKPHPCQNLKCPFGQVHSITAICMISTFFGRKFRQKMSIFQAVFAPYRSFSLIRIPPLAYFSIWIYSLFMRMNLIFLLRLLN